MEYPHRYKLRRLKKKLSPVGFQKEKGKQYLNKKNSGYFIQKRSCKISIRVEYASNSLLSVTYPLLGFTRALYF